MLVRKYFVVDTNTGEHMHRDFIAENRIKRSYAWQRMEESLESEDPPQDDDFYTDLGLPPMPRMNSAHFDDAGREWKYTIKGWQIIPNEYDPVVKMTKLEVVVAHKSKQSWFDLSNKHHLKNWKTGVGLIDNFDDYVSGFQVWGKMDGGDIDLGNERGENSVVEGNGINSNDFGFPGPRGAKITYWGHLPNGSSYALDAARRASRGVNYVEKLYDEFNPKTQYQLDSIRLDSIFQNEITPFTEDAFHHWSVPYAWQKDSIPYIFPTDFYPKRKDSATVRILIRKRTDSIKIKYNK